MSRKITILGSTGSIGTQTLQLIDRYPEEYTVIGLSSYQNAELLLEQILRYRPRYAAIGSKQAADALRHKIPETTTLLSGPEGLQELAGMEEGDILLVAVVGIAGLPAVMAGIQAGKTIALANKEALVTGGALVKKALNGRHERLLPVDSEHSAIFQCLQGQDTEAARRLILTASGGPFHQTPKEDFSKITLAQALKHPNWTMGRKITIDSATLMNKGLEVIEAHWLFDMPLQKIDVVVHPESIIHSMVEYEDGSVLAQMSNPDMRLPILYALEYPRRKPCGVKPLDLTALKSLSFFKPDLGKFPALGLAFEALKMGGTASAVLNAANEVAVEWFLKEKIRFCDIPGIIEHTIFHTDIINDPTIEDIYAADSAVRATLHGKENGREDTK